MEASEEIKKYEETVNRLYKLLKRVCQERDEARDQLQSLIRNFQPSTSSVKSNTISDTCSKSIVPFSNGSCDLSLSNEPNHQNKMKKHSINDASRDNNGSSSQVIEKLVCGKPLPQKGKLLKSVAEAGPLLHTLLVEPLPQWKNPPLCSSSRVSLSSDNNYLSTNVKKSNGFVPTSLSLAFPGNSSGPSQMSHAVVKNESVSYMDIMDSNGMHNHTIAGKKRKFL